MYEAEFTETETRAGSAPGEETRAGTARCRMKAVHSLIAHANAFRSHVRTKAEPIIDHYSSRDPLID